jgi:photosystem II stability/assembly factor-like uncharacterized protein
LTNAHTVSFYVDPDNPQTIYLATADHGLYVSSQGGINWSQIGAPMDQVRVLEFIKIDGILFARSENDLYYKNDGFIWQQSILLDTVNFSSTTATGNFIINFNEQLYAASIWGNGLFTSNDGGATWSGLSTSLDDKKLSTFQIYGESLYCGTEGSGLYVTSDGQNWITTGTSMEGKNFSEILVMDNLMLAGGSDGLFQSTDGLVWQPAATPLDDRAINTLDYQAGFLYAGTETGLYYSENDGSTWDYSLTDKVINCLLSVDGLIYAGTNTGIYSSIDSGRIWDPANPPVDSQNIIKFASDGQTMYSITSEGLYRSLSGENNWFPADRITHPDILRGILVIQNYILAYGSKIHFSTNAGKDWHITSSPVDWGSEGIVEVIALDQGFIAATSTGIFHSWNGINWIHRESPLDSLQIVTFIRANEKLYAGTNGKGVYYSADDGYDWTQSNLQMIDMVITDLLSVDNRIFAGTMNNGVYYSLDNGKSWISGNPTLINITINDLCYNDGKLFAGTENNGMYVSTDQGQSWTATGPMTQAERIEKIFAHNDFMICGGAGQNFISRDGGLTWVPAEAPLVTREIVDFSVVDSVFYLSTWHSVSDHADVFRSIDYGYNWSSLNLGLTGEYPYTAPKYLLQVDQLFVASDGVYQQKQDLEPPSETSISRVDTTRFVTSECTNFTVHALGADSMILSEFSDFRDATWQVYQIKTNYCILQQAVGKISIYIKFKDFSGNHSAADSVTFEFDTTSPIFSPSYIFPYENLEPVPISQPLEITAFNEEITSLHRLKNFFIYYREAGETFNDQHKISAELVWISVPGNSGLFPIWRGPISADLLTSNGIDLRIVAEDSAGNSTTMTVKDMTYISQPLSLYGKHLGTSFLIPGGTGSAGFRIVSLPMKPGKNEFQASLLGRFGDYGEKGDWMFWRYEGNTQWRSSSNMALEDGKGYFLQLRNSGRVSPGGQGTTMKTTAGVLGEISGWQLRPDDWTLIGNPYMVEIQLNQLKLKNRDILLSEVSPYFQVWAYNGGGENNGWTNQDISLEPWGGLAIFLADSLAGPDTIIFANQQEPWELPLGKKQTSYTDQLAKLSETDWLVQIKVEGDGFSDRQNYFGCRKDARIDQDAYDWYEPPILPGGLSLNFPHPEWNVSSSYACDIRPATNQGYVWDLSISGEGGTSVSLAFEYLHTVPPGFQILLLDDQTGLVRDLHKQSDISVRLPKEGQGKTLKIIAGTDAFIKNQTNNLPTIPDHFSLNQNYPNPFNPTTVIRYGLPIEGRVTLKIFDLLGREVLALEQDDFHEAGYYEQVVDMQKYGSGIYFYQIKVSGEESFGASRKMLLVK